MGRYGDFKILNNGGGGEGGGGRGCNPLIIHYFGATKNI